MTVGATRWVAQVGLAYHACVLPSRATHRVAPTEIILYPHSYAIVTKHIILAYT